MGRAGTLPSNWGMLPAWPQLRALALRSTGLGGPLPRNWAVENGFPLLMLLDLGRNRLAGTLPDTWGACGALCFEYLHYMCARTRLSALSCTPSACSRMRPGRAWLVCGDLLFMSLPCCLPLEVRAGVFVVIDLMMGRAASWTATSCRGACRAPGPARAPSARSTSCARRRCHATSCHHSFCLLGSCRMHLDNLRGPATRRGFDGRPCCGRDVSSNELSGGIPGEYGLLWGEVYATPRCHVHITGHAAMRAEPCAACCLMSACAGYCIAAPQAGLHHAGSRRPATSVCAARCPPG